MLLVEKMGELSAAYDEKQRQINDEIEREKQETERKREERRQREIHEREKEFWEEKFNAELRMTEKKIEMEVKASLAKLPRLKITPFKVSNLKSGSVGYKMAWERLKIEYGTEYGQTRVVISAHLDEIINLPIIKGTNHDRIQEFYDKLSSNFDALQTLGEGDKLQGFVMNTLNKLPHVKPDLVRIDNKWEEWNMEALITNLQAWLGRNRTEDVPKTPFDHRKRERNWFSGNGKPKPKCIFCNEDHWIDECKKIVTQDARRKFFVDKSLCFNCGRAGHRGSQCRSRGCFKCGSRHHTSICDKEQSEKPKMGGVLNGYSGSTASNSLPAIIPVELQGEVMWAYLDTGSAKNFVFRDAVKKLNLKPERHEQREIVTLNGVTTQSMLIYKMKINALNGEAHEEFEVTRSKLPDFTTVRRPNIPELKLKYEHMKDKTFYYTENRECQIHLILGDKTFSRIRTENVFKGEEGDPIVEQTSFGWVIHRGDDYTDDQCMFTRETGL